MGVPFVNTAVSRTAIGCDESFLLTLTLTAAPDLAGNPADIVLVLDRSGSMEGEALTAMKLGAEAFIDLIAAATGAEANGIMGGGSRIGLVSFADSAAADAALDTDIAAIKCALNGLCAQGQTNHAAALACAIAQFDPISSSRKVLVLFTDGVSTVGGDTQVLVDQARALGIGVYIIGLDGADGMDEAALAAWAGEPAAAHVAITPNGAEPEALFAALAEHIASPGASNIEITEMLNPDFAVLAVYPPNCGSAVRLNDTTVRWNIEELGQNAEQTAVLQLLVCHVAQADGQKQVHAAVGYRDDQQHQVVFPNPQLTVACSIPVDPEPSLQAQAVPLEGCSDTVRFTADDVWPGSSGRIVEVSTTVRNVCPNRRVALAVMLFERDELQNEVPLGMRTLILPAHDGASCRDIEVRRIRFVLPDPVDANGASVPCAMRNVHVRLLANVLDHGYTCCAQDAEAESML